MVLVAPLPTTKVLIQLRIRTFCFSMKYTKRGNNKCANQCPAMNIYNVRPTKYIAQTTDTSHILHNEIIKIIVLCGQ